MDSKNVISYFFMLHSPTPIDALELVAGLGQSNKINQCQCFDKCHCKEGGTTQGKQLQTQNAFDKEEGRGILE
jgi:hypothetical protein